MNEASPRFRQDLQASATEADGVACIDVTDPRTGTNFRFYDFEYQLALQFNGQPVRDVIAWASETFGADLTAEGVNEFAGRLSELGFLETPAGAPAVAPAAADATPGSGIKLADGLDSAEAEWMTTEGAKTASFVPDPAMLDSPGDLTPVAPHIPGMEADADADASVDVTTDEPTPAPDKAKEPAAPTAHLFDLLAPAAAAKAPTPPSVASAAPVPAIPTRAPAVAEKPAHSWATDLEGTLEAGAAAKPNAADTKTPPPLSVAPVLPPIAPAPPGIALTPPPALKPPAAPPPSAPRAAAAPPGLPERRQPPAPEAVLMTAFAENAAGGAAKPKKNTGRVVAIVILLLAIAGISYVAWTYERAHRLPQAVRVRVLSPKPTAAYLWYPGTGTVTDHEARTLGFESAGTLAELLPAGTAFGADDILGRLRGAQPVEALLGRHRARLAFYEQMRDSMRAANNQVELRQAEIKLVEKQRLVEESMAQLAKLVIRASEPGEIVETLAKVGRQVRAHAPLVRVKGRMLHGEFELEREEIAKAEKLGFCRVEVVGLGPRASNTEAPAAAGTAADVASPDAQAVPRFVDCTGARATADWKKLRVAVPGNLGLVPGQPLRLARKRYDAVFPVPRAAVTADGSRRAIWIAGADGKAERRDVAVVELEPALEGAAGDVLVSEGLRVGDEVIISASADLRPGAAVVVER
jgi:hypothetical protein